MLFYLPLFANVANQLFQIVHSVRLAFIVVGWVKAQLIFKGVAGERPTQFLLEILI